MPGLTDATSDLLRYQRSLSNTLLNLVGSLGPEGKMAEEAARALEAAATAAFQFADSASKAANAFAAVQTRLLSSVRETGAISAIGAAGGFDAAALAAAFHQRITTDPVAMGAAGSLGVQAVGGPFGTRDLATNFIAVLKGIRQIQDREEQLLALRRLGLEQAEPLTRVSNRTFGEITGNDASASAFVNDDAHQGRAAEFTAQAGRLQKAKDDFMAAISDGPMDDFAEMMEAAATQIRDFSTWVKKNESILGKIGHVFAYIIDPGSALSHDLALKSAKETNTWEGKNAAGDAMDNHVSALDRNTQALNRVTDTWGGGPRSHSALPRAGRTSELIRSGSIANLPAI